VIDAICVRVNAFVELRRNAKREGPKESGGSEDRDKSTRARAASHRRRASRSLPNL